MSLCAGFTGHEGENMWTLSFTVSKKAVKRWEYGWAATYTTYKCKQSKPRLLLIKRMPNWVQSTLGAHYQQQQNHWLFPAGSEAKGACQQVLEWPNWCINQVGSGKVTRSGIFKPNLTIFLPNWVQSTLGAHYQLPENALRSVIFQIVFACSSLTKNLNV